MAKAKKSEKTIKVTLVRSPIGTLPRHRECVRGLGLKRMNHTVELEDTPSVRGMVNKINYMVRVEEA
jgi:large subunit ribosomal protein L30